MASSVRNKSVSQYAQASDSNSIHFVFSANDGVEKRNNGTILSADESDVDDTVDADLLTDAEEDEEVSSELVSGRWYIENTKKYAPTSSMGGSSPFGVFLDTCRLLRFQPMNIILQKC